MKFVFGILFLAFSTFLLASCDFIKIDGWVQCCTESFKNVTSNVTVPHCLNMPKPALLELWNKDLGKRTNPSDKVDFYLDDPIAKVPLTPKGRFTIEGDLKEKTDAKFFLRLFHQCGLRKNEKEKRCIRVSRFGLPDTAKNNPDSFKLFPWRITSANEEKDHIVCP